MNSHNDKTRLPCGTLVRVIATTIKTPRTITGLLIVGIPDVMIRRDDVGIIIDERCSFKVGLMYVNGNIVSCTGEVERV